MKNTKIPPNKFDRIFVLLTPPAMLPIPRTVVGADSISARPSVSLPFTATPPNPYKFRQFNYSLFISASGFILHYSLQNSCQMN